MGKNVVVIGTQWGDEGKGKVVDLLTEEAARSPAVASSWARSSCASAWRRASAR
ncbi:MAG: adenylosuccinate synthetase [Xanthomonadaceae bacterium]|nr:adenylosuccinate synthetase [Xanthomonadaceae bacterium]